MPRFSLTRFVSTTFNTGHLFLIKNNEKGKNSSKKQLDQMLLTGLPNKYVKIWKRESIDSNYRHFLKNHAIKRNRKNGSEAERDEEFREDFQLYLTLIKNTYT